MEANTVVAMAIRSVLTAGQDIKGCLRAGRELKTLFPNECKLACNLHKTHSSNTLVHLSALAALCVFSSQTMSAAR